MADANANQAGPNGVGNQQPENTEWMYGDAGYSLTAGLGTMGGAIGSITGSPTAGTDEIVNRVVAKITGGAGTTAGGTTTGNAGTTGTAGASTAGTTTGGTANMQDQAGITKK